MCQHNERQIVILTPERSVSNSADSFTYPSVCSFRCHHRSPSPPPPDKVVLRCVSSDGNQYVQVVRSPGGLRVEFGQRDRTNHELISTFLIYCLLRSDKKLQGERRERAEYGIIRTASSSTYRKSIPAVGCIGVLQFYWRGKFIDTCAVMCEERWKFGTQGRDSRSAGTPGP